MKSNTIETSPETGGNEYLDVLGGDFHQIISDIESLSEVTDSGLEDPQKRAGIIDDVEELDGQKVHDVFAFLFDPARKLYQLAAFSEYLEAPYSLERIRKEMRTAEKGISCYRLFIDCQVRSEMANAYLGIFQKEAARMCQEGNLTACMFLEMMANHIRQKAL